ncbi:MAG: VWA domain-containing protein [Candidatus Hydrogenedentes bacterium]|nr:VWA domain-containing protein [Candidatus Hydrogenedentota bacterium]
MSHDKRNRTVLWGITLALVFPLLAASTAVRAQFAPSTSLEGYAFKIYRTESGLYPFVRVYMRTFDQNMQPLLNLNELNVGVMVDGRSYDPAKRQYTVQTLRTCDEAVQCVFVIDCSGSMAGPPFQAALNAATRFITNKRPQDQIGIIAVRDSDNLYELVSNFEKNSTVLGQRMLDLRADAKTTRLYDGIYAAIQMCGMTPTGGVNSADADYIASRSIIVFSDGKDEGSVMSRDDLMTRISNMTIPIPIYSLAYTRVERKYLGNLEALSKNTFGKYFDIGEALENMTRSVEDIQNIVQNDYVVTLRSYQPVDGRPHSLKIGLEYPSRSGRMTYQDTQFEAIEPPPLELVLQKQAVYNHHLKPLTPPDSPYLQNPYSAQTQPPAPSMPPEPPQGQ